MNPSRDSHAGDDQVHRGHDLEAGVLQRVREWTDVFPWVRLGRVLRVAGSPPLLALVAIALAVWSSSLTWFDGPTAAAPRAQAEVDSSANRAAVMVMARVSPGETFSGRPTRWWKRLSWPARLWRLAWSLIIWAPVALLIARQGALLCAGRPLAGLNDSVTQAVRRTPVAWLAGAVPWGCIAVIGIPIVAVGWVEQAVGGFGWMEVPAALLIAAIALPCGMLGFGAIVAIPLSWAAIVNEPTADALDSLSRGYESLFRRPLQLVLYVGVCLVIGLVLWTLVWGIAQGSTLVAVRLLGVDYPLADGDPNGTGVAERTVWLLKFLPTVGVITLSWGLVGGVYLLLRQDAGGQEVEDLWQPAPPARQPLPPLENV